MSYLEDRLKRKNGELPALPTKKERKAIPKKSAKRIKQEKEFKEHQKKDTELQKWYSKIMATEKPVCWETNEWIGKENKKAFHGSIAHILPKSLFPSVATHPLNYMILKMYGGTHGQYDSSWENASKMKVWGYACKIFNILYPLLTREEKAKLPEIILQEIKPEIYNG